MSFFCTYSRTFQAGKYRGEHVANVPTSYIVWCLRTIEDLDQDARHRLQFEVRAREAWAGGQKGQRQGAHNFATAPRLKPEQVPVALELIAAGRRALAARNHPDIGGDGDRMKQINVVADDLESGLRAMAGGAA